MDRINHEFSGTPYQCDVWPVQTGGESPSQNLIVKELRKLVEDRRFGEGAVVKSNGWRLRLEVSETRNRQITDRPATSSWAGGMREYHPYEEIRRSVRRVSEQLGKHDIRAVVAICSRNWGLTEPALYEMLFDSSNGPLREGQCRRVKGILFVSNSCFDSLLDRNTDFRFLLNPNADEPYVGPLEAFTK